MGSVRSIVNCCLTSGAQNKFFPSKGRACCVRIAACVSAIFMYLSKSPSGERNYPQTGHHDAHEDDETMGLTESASQRLLCGLCGLCVQPQMIVTVVTVVCPYPPILLHPLVAPPPSRKVEQSSDARSAIWYGHGTAWYGSWYRSNVENNQCLCPVVSGGTRILPRVAPLRLPLRRPPPRLPPCPFGYWLFAVAYSRRLGVEKGAP